MINVAVIFAGGSGTRMKSSGLPKQFLELYGKPVIIYTLEQFERHPMIDFIVVACIGTHIKYLQSLIERFHLLKVKVLLSEEKVDKSLFIMLYQKLIDLFQIPNGQLY